MKKIVIIIFAAILVLLVLIVLISFRFKKQSTETPETFSPPTPTRYIPPPLPTIPPQDTISVNGIEIKNIYKDSKDRNVQGDVDFSSSPTYSLVYMPDYKEFLITILSVPFEENRAIAEAEFLKKLEITEEQACLLKVVVSTPYRVDPERGGIKYPLSFCDK